MGPFHSGFLVKRGLQLTGWANVNSFRVAPKKRFFIPAGPISVVLRVKASGRKEPGQNSQNPRRGRNQNPRLATVGGGNIFSEKKKSGCYAKKFVVGGETLRRELKLSPLSIDNCHRPFGKQGRPVRTRAASTRAAAGWTIGPSTRSRKASAWVVQR